MKIDTTPLALYAFFVERVRENLHIAFTFSPIGNLFKHRLQSYPTLNNYCTIDWFTEWPRDALQYIAEKFIGNMNLSTGKVIDMSLKNDDNATSDPNSQQGSGNSNLYSI